MNTKDFKKYHSVIKIANSIYDEDAARKILCIVKKTLESRYGLEDKDVETLISLFDFN